MSRKPEFFFSKYKEWSDNEPYQLFAIKLYYSKRNDIVCSITKSNEQLQLEYYDNQNNSFERLTVLPNNFIHKSRSRQLYYLRQAICKSLY